MDSQGCWFLASGAASTGIVIHGLTGRIARILNTLRILVSLL